MGNYLPVWALYGSSLCGANFLCQYNYRSSSPTPPTLFLHNYHAHCFPLQIPSHYPLISNNGSHTLVPYNPATFQFKHTPTHSMHGSKTQQLSALFGLTAFWTCLASHQIILFLLFYQNLIHICISGWTKVWSCGSRVVYYWYIARYGMSIVRVYWIWREWENNEWGLEAKKSTKSTQVISESYLTFWYSFFVCIVGVSKLTSQPCLFYLSESWTVRWIQTGFKQLYRLSQKW